MRLIKNRWLHKPFNPWHKKILALLQAEDEENRLLGYSLQFGQDIGTAHSLVLILELLLVWCDTETVHCLY